LTEPVGVPDGDTPVTVAVKVTEDPESDGFEEELMAVLLVPVPVTKKPKNKVDDPVGVFTEKACCPVVAVGAMSMITDRLVEVPPGWTVAVKPVPVNTMDVTPVKLVPVMIALIDEPGAPEDTDMDVMVGCKLVLESSTSTKFELSGTAKTWVSLNVTPCPPPPKEFCMFGPIVHASVAGS
jgi:hypothetical protein